MLFTPLAAMWFLVGLLVLIGIQRVGHVLQPGSTSIFSIWFWTWTLAGLASLISAQGILRRWPKGRTWAAFVCTIHAVTTLPVALAALNAPEAIGAGWGVLLGMTEVTIIVLLMLPKTRLDFEWAQIKRIEARGHNGGDLLQYAKARF